MLPSMKSPLAVLIFLVVPMGIPGPHRVFASEEWRERLLNEAPKALGALEAFTAELEGSFTVTAETTRAPGARNVGLIERCRKDFVSSAEFVWVRTRVLEQKQKKDRLQEHLRGFNSRYAFHLVRSSPDDQWVLKSMGERSKNFLSQLDVDLYQYIRGSWAMDAVPLGLNTLDIRQVKPEQRGEKNLVRVDFGISAPDSETLRQQLQGSRLLKRFSIEELQHRLTVPDAWLVLDPNNYWCLQEFQRINGDEFHQASMEYGEKINGFPVVRRRSYTLGDKEGLHRTVVTTEFERVAHRKAPESEFTLAAFGLQEPGFPMAVPEEPSHLSRWLLLGAVVLAILAGLVGWYLKRKGLMPAST